MTTATPSRPHDTAGRLPGPPARSAGSPASPTATAADRARLARRPAVAVVLSSAFGGEFKADYSAPGSDSEPAQQLLAERFPAQSGDTVDVVVRSDGRRSRPGRQGRRHGAAGQARRRSRTSSASPTRTRRPAASPPTARTLVAHARLDVVNPPDMPVRTASGCSTSPTRASRPGVRSRWAARRSSRPSRAPSAPRASACRRRDHPAAHVRLGRRRRTADPGGGRRAGGQQHAHDRASSRSSTRRTGRPRWPR